MLDIHELGHHCAGAKKRRRYVCPVILGSDKTTVSVATGQNDFHPAYLSLGNVHNSVRRAHGSAVSVVVFLPIPKSGLHVFFVGSFKPTMNAADKEHEGCPKFRKFRRQLTHISFKTMIAPLQPGMTTPQVCRCPDRHYRNCIYGCGGYILDYPDQVGHSCIVQGWCPKYVIHLRVVCRPKIIKFATGVSRSQKILTIKIR